MIRSFRCSETEDVYEGRRCPRFTNIRSVLERKLAMLAAAASINDLRTPPNNRLEKLVRDGVGQHSIRINDQFRLCFRWTDNGPEDVEVVDYHR
jgi:proteic killer suppression protein